MSRVRPWLARTALTILVLSGLAAITLALPLERWRTGMQPVPPLPLVPGGPQVERTERIWIDSDAACGTGARADSDDCLALLALLRTDAVEVVGVSSVAGNADDMTTRRTLTALLDRVEDPPRLFTGAAASPALRRALAEEPLTLVALGPLTNVARSLENAPELRRNVMRLVAVMGRRHGHLFHPSEGNGAGMLFGHGPIFTDFNVRQDPGAAARVLAMDLPLTLVPYELARSVQVDAAALDALARSGPAGAWVAARSRDWLNHWHRTVGTSGFYPFDLLAAAYVLAPERFDCAAVMAWAAPTQDLLGWLYPPLRTPLSVLVGLPPERPAQVHSESRVLYCTGLRTDVLDLLQAPKRT